MWDTCVFGRHPGDTSQILLCFQMTKKGFKSENNNVNIDTSISG